MKNILAITFLIFAMNTNAFFGGNNMPWDNGNNNMPWDGNNMPWDNGNNNMPWDGNNMPWDNGNNNMPWDGNNMPWDGNNMPWDNNRNHNYGYYQDNGIFSYNPYEYWDPRWYAEEMVNMFDEFDDNGYNNNPYGNNTYNRYNGPWGYRNTMPISTPIR